MKKIKLLVDKKKEERKVGDVWEDEHHRYEKKEGYTLKLVRTHERFPRN